MLRKELNKYKKRLSRHIQIDLAAQRAGRKTTKRTLNAIENNRQWVAHYEAQLEAATMAVAAN